MQRIEKYIGLSDKLIELLEGQLKNKDEIIRALKEKIQMMEYKDKVREALAELSELQIGLELHSKSDILARIRESKDEKTFLQKIRR